MDKLAGTSAHIIEDTMFLGYSFFLYMENVLDINVLMLTTTTYFMYKREIFQGFYVQVISMTHHNAESARTNRSNPIISLLFKTNCNVSRKRLADDGNRYNQLRIIPKH